MRLSWSIILLLLISLSGKGGGWGRGVARVNTYLPTYLSDPWGQGIGDMDLDWYAILPSGEDLAVYYPPLFGSSRFDI